MPTKAQDISTGIISAGAAAIPAVGAISGVMGAVGALINGPASQWTSQSAHDWFHYYSPQAFQDFCTSTGVNVNDLNTVWPVYALWMWDNRAQGYGGPKANDSGFIGWFRARNPQGAAMPSSLPSRDAVKEAVYPSASTAGSVVNAVADKAASGAPLTKDENAVLNAAALAGGAMQAGLGDPATIFKVLIALAVITVLYRVWKA